MPNKKSIRESGQPWSKPVWLRSSWTRPLASSQSRGVFEDNRVLTMFESAGKASMKSSPMAPLFMLPNALAMSNPMTALQLTTFSASILCVISTTALGRPRANCSGPSSSAAAGVRTANTALKAMRRSAAVITRGRTPPPSLRRQIRRPALAQS